MKRILVLVCFFSLLFQLWSKDKTNYFNQWKINGTNVLLLPPTPPANTVTSLWTHIVWEAKTNWTGMNINGLEAGVVVTNFSACFVWEGHTNNIWQKVEMSNLAVWREYKQPQLFGSTNTIWLTNIISNPYLLQLYDIR